MTTSADQTNQQGAAEKWTDASEELERLRLVQVPAASNIPETPPPPSVQCPPPSTPAVEKPVTIASAADTEAPTVTDPDLLRGLFRAAENVNHGDSRFLALLKRLSEDVKPRDIVEKLWLHQFCLLVWDNTRLRYVQAQAQSEVVRLAAAPQLDHFKYFLNRLDHVERLITANEARQFALLREIERHRATLAQRLQQAAESAEVVEFTEIEGPDGLQ